MLIKICVSSCRSQADLELVLQDLKSSLEIKHLGFPIESYLHKVWDTRISMHRAWNVNNHGLLLLNNELLEILTVAITAIFEEICEGIYSTKFQPNMAVIAMISVDWEKVHQIFHCLNNQYATVEKCQSKVWLTERLSVTQWLKISSTLCLNNSFYIIAIVAAELKYAYTLILHLN